MAFLLVVQIKGDHVVDPDEGQGHRLTAVLGDLHDALAPGHQHVGLVSTLHVRLFIEKVKKDCEYAFYWCFAWYQVIFLFKNFLKLTKKPKGMA